MAVRKSERRRLRNELISRTARVWSRLNRNLVKELNEVAQDWIKKLSQDIEAKFPEKFTKILKRNLREALAYGYWLQYLYLYELRGKKYRGKIKLAEGDSVKENVQKFMSTGEWNEVIPEDAVKWINNYVPTLSGNFSHDILEKTRDVIKQSLLDGATLQERMKALQGVLDLSKSRIETIARTEITRADTLGRLTSMKANDDVIGVEFSAIMDDRTTDICASRHGLVMRLDDPRLSENTPPCHVNCRSLLLSLTIYDYPDGLLTSHEFDEIPPGIQRPEDIEEVQKILESATKTYIHEKKNANKEPSLEERALHINELDENQKISLISELAKSMDLPYNQKRTRHGEDIYKDDNGHFIYPPNDGFAGKIEDVILEPDSEINLIDRYGKIQGRFFSPVGTPFEKRALPSISNNLSIYHKYKVLRPFSAKKGTIAGWFNQPGGGVQYLTEKSAKELLEEGYLEEVFDK